MKQKIMKVGNSLGVTISAKFVKSVGIKPGDDVKVNQILEKNQIIYSFKGGVRQLSLGSNLLKKE